ncbi:MAG: acetyl-CoA carboxylase biotin carboxylase subunit, partial [Candidatus Aminicenantes bacterium]|nr:acetyl-CoA carboxylase biotin carboxylase subunit [Candidatus Aminicenantes bacterium]
EHPVTEMVTGIDLVKNQIKIAAGLCLPFCQEDIKFNGFSMQCRIYAEDPDNEFMPSPGKIIYLRAPSGGLGIRDDNGVYEGYMVPLEYDPLLSKLITWGTTRAEAIHRMLRALSEYQIYGIKTTIPFFKRILLHPNFIAGDYNTHFISNLEKEEDGEKPDDLVVALIAAGIKSYKQSDVGLSHRQKRKESNWKFQGRLQNFANRR